MIHEAELKVQEHAEVYDELDRRMGNAWWQKQDARMFGTGYVREYRYANPQSLHDPQIFEEYITYMRWGRVVASFHNYAVASSELHDGSVGDVTVYGIYTDTHAIEVHRDGATAPIAQNTPQNEEAMWAELTEVLARR